MFRALILNSVLVISVFADPYDVKNYNNYEKLVYLELKNTVPDFKSKRIGIKSLKDNIVFTTGSDGKVVQYLKVNNGKVEGYLNIKGALRDQVVEHMRYIDYVEIEPFLMYKKSDVINGKIKDGSKSIDVYSEEYYQIWKDLDFYKDATHRSEFVRRAETWVNSLDEETVENLTVYTFLKLKEFLYLRQMKMINDELYKKYLPIVISHLPTQCADTRYSVFEGEKFVFSVGYDGDKLKAVYKAAKNIDQEEIEWYFKYGYIDKKLKDKCLDIIKKR